LDWRLSNDAHDIWMYALALFITISVDAGDVILQPLPCAALSCHTGGRHQGVTVGLKAPDRCVVTLAAKSDFMK